jgi:hypothetical protein
LLACAGGAAQPPVATLTKHTFGGFEKAFDEASDRVRVVAMFSPT